MFDELKKKVKEANQALESNNLVKLMFGNVSALSENGEAIAIKPSGVPYKNLQNGDIVLLDKSGNKLEGNLRPSSDTLTHLEIYKSFQGVGAVVHTHSPNATIFAQAKMPIQCYGTTHADHFYGEIPVSRELSESEIAENYELNTGKAIVETFKNLKINPLEVPACLVPHHGSFVWGKNLSEAIDNAIALEEIARMKLELLKLNPSADKIPKALLDKHYLRKNGKNAYYGQDKG